MKLEVFGNWNLTEIVEHIRLNGGLTIEAYTGNQPQHGYVINDNLNRTVISESEFFSAGEQTLHQFGLLVQHCARYIGIWHDIANCTVILDTVNIVRQKKEALNIGVLRHQRYIWDADNQNELVV